MSNRHAYDLYSDAEWEAVQAKSRPFTEQMKSVIKEDPGVPFFLGLTCFALAAGFRQSFIVRDTAKANHYMFMRVGFQACAAAALGYSIFKASTKDSFTQADIEQKINAKAAEDAAKAAAKDL